MSCHQEPIDDGEGLPIGLGELHLFLFPVREARHMFALHKRHTLIFGVTEHSRRMTHQRNELTRVVERLEKSDRNGALGKVPHGSVPTHIEDGVEVYCSHVGKFRSLGEWFSHFFVLLEPCHRGRLTFGKITLSIKWWLPAVR
ncbi:MAG: hypothetical protein SA176_17620 [Edaphobacter sp.]|nr:MULTISPECIES: hypothetical protein [Acidobacteriaceae]MDW5267565.1 hypothetical protein [Edaphobacter sp.]